MTEPCDPSATGLARTTEAGAAGGARATDLDTFPKLLLDNRERLGARPAIREKDYGIWQTWTWRQVADEVRALACGLADLGLKRGDKVAIIGDNRFTVLSLIAAGPY